jgi:hypothetical protein
MGYPEFLEQDEKYGRTDAGLPIRTTKAPAESLRGPCH